MMGDQSNLIQDHNSLMQTVSGGIAAIGLEKTGNAVAGTMVTPAVWALNYAVNGKTPDNVDVGLFGLGLAGGPFAVASISTGIIKAVIDDQIEVQLREVRLNEEAKYRPYIIPCSKYASSGPGINAMAIASRGGTAWQHPNGLWVYIVDASGKLVADFKPKKATKLYQPVWPLKGMGAGKFRWHMVT
jgi:hypothetical protein